MPPHPWIVRLISFSVRFMSVDGVGEDLVTLIPAVATALTVEAERDALEVDSSVFLDKLVSLVDRLSQNPHIHGLVLPVPVGEHTAEVRGTSPLRVGIDTAAVVLRVNEFLLHALIIARLWPHTRGWGLFLVALSACPIRGRGRRRISRSWDSFGLS